MSDWDASEDEAAAAPSAPAARTKPAATGRSSKWDDEDVEDNKGVASDWDDSEEEEEEKPAPSTLAAPPKKKGTIKQKIAEKEALKAQRAAEGDDDDDVYNSDDVLDPREKARRDKEKELNSDLNNAAELFGAAALGGTSNKELDNLLSYEPRTKDDFQELSRRIIDLVIKRHQSKPLYASFVEYHVRELAGPLRDVEVRKAASGLTTLANEKQKEQKDKASGKKKKNVATKPALGSAKVSSKFDTTAYGDEALDDFGPNDFM